MDPLYLRKRLINQNFNNRALDTHKTEKTDSVNISQDAKTNVKNQAENLAQDIRSEVLNPKQLKMNYLAGMERSGYVKKVMNLPKTLPELLMQLQNEDSIVEQEYTPKYTQEGEGEKNNKEQPKSDIREGIIRNAKETFEGVKGQIEGGKGQIDAQKPGSAEVPRETQQQNTEAQQPSSSEAQRKPQQQNTEAQQPSGLAAKKELPQPEQPTRPNVPHEEPQIEQPIINKPVVNQPEQEPQQPINTEAQKPSSSEAQREPQQQNTEAQQPSGLAAKKELPQLEQQTRPNIPQEEPTQNIPQTPNQPVQNKPVEQPQVKPNLPNIPHEEPTQNIPQQPRPTMPELPQPEQPTIPVVNQPTTEPTRPNIPQEQTPINQPSVPNRPPVNTEVRHDAPQPQPAAPQNTNQPSQPVNTEAQKPSGLAAKKELPQPEQPTRPSVNLPEQEPQQPINQPSVPNRPPVNTEVRHDTPQPQPTAPQNTSQPSQPVVNKPTEQPTPAVPQTPNQPVQNKPVEQPQVKPNLPNIPHEEPTQNVPQQTRPTMPELPQPEQPTRPVVNQPEQEPQQPINQPSVPNTNVKPQPNVPQEPNQPIRPNIPQPNINRPEPRPELPNYRPFEPIHHPEMNNMRPNTIMDNRAAIIQNQINQNMPFIRPQEPNIYHHHHMDDQHHRMDDTPKAENIQPQIVQNTQTEPTMTEMKQKLSGDATELFFTGLINLNDLSSSLKDGSKTARSKLIMAMANASRQGIDNSQINDTMKLLNAGLVAEENSTPSKILKNIIELYLPWYPLQQGVGFDLSIETTPGGSESFLSTLKVWIQTRNYGNVNAILALMAGNSVDMNIKCAKAFPKEDLLKRLKEETSNHSMQSNINVEEISRVESYTNSDQQAKVNLSSTYELNPYLLLMAHSFIKNTIIIDSAAIIG